MCKASGPHEKDRAPVCRKAENNRTGLIFSACDHIVEQLVDTALPTKNHTKDGNVAQVQVAAGNRNTKGA